ncbi:MAG TPA: hypothetical protein VMV61_15095 [Patescibacteria group bacterium]|nr:hypothetical protein [Patescibacteria group bacterium]
MAHTVSRGIFAGLTAAGLVATWTFVAGVALAAAPSQPAPNEAPTKVWTNNSIRALGNEPASFQGDGHPIAGSAPSAAAIRASGAQKATQPLPPRELDPGWYRVRLAQLRADAARAQAEADRIQSELDSHSGGHKGNNLLAEPEGITPQSEIRILHARRDRDLKQIDALEDMARRNGISPGELRREPSAEDYADYQALELPPPPQEPQGLPKTEAEWRARFAQMRRELAAAIEERDALQREFNIAQLQYYPNPNTTLKESVTFHQENVLRDRINAQDAKIRALRQQLSDLEDALRRAGGPPGWARPRG